MHYRALATDYDGTLARDGHAGRGALDALARLQESGRALLLVTGRQLPDLESVFPELGLFDRVVAENGALVYSPSTGEQRLFGEAPPDELVREALRRGVTRFSLGQVIFAAWKPHEVVLLEIIRELGLEHRIVFNKDAVMVLPSGVNKATGLRAALRELALAPEETVGIGDAENDHAFLDACGLAVAVANALPSLKQHCHLVTQGEAGDGVQELIERWLAGRLPDA